MKNGIAIVMGDSTEISVKVCKESVSIPPKSCHGSINFLGLLIEILAKPT